ncbi:MAG: universal stress protein [Euryarchaeota archaeon]|nr:universal stress protein [Euryarchaeota archaeon]
MKILAAVKFSDDRNPVVETGVNFACHVGASLHFLHVVDRTPLRRSFVREMPESMKEYLVRRGEEILKNAKKQAKRCGISVRTMLLEGHPEEVILREAQRHDLLIMRSRVFSPAERLGSVAEKVLSKVAEPVMLVNEPQEKFEVCLVPVDGSEESFKSLYEIKKRNDVYRFERVIILHIHRDGEKAGEEAPESERRDRYGHRVVLEAAEGIVRDSVPSVECEVVHTSRDVADAILEYSREKGVDLIFMGMTGKGRIQRFFMGSVSRRVASFSRVPVVIFPTPYVP